eukprot:GHVS01049326.1.p1 GENE.GHVS01049326.1~~GHVS01049326.1.p1  ORF type:complete len:440 (+),score=35.67 GHVS01049326.1:164-1483(+)
MAVLGGGGSLACTLEKFWHRISVIEKYSRKPIRPMTMKRLLAVSSSSTSAIIKSGDWVRTELSVRLAHRLFDFHRLPFAVLGNPHVRETYDVYISTFERMSKLKPVETIEDEQGIVSVLEEERMSHDKTVDYMGQGVKQLRLVCPDINLDSFLERFFFFRIGRRIMIDHLLAMNDPRANWTGCIHLECKPVDIIHARAEDVRASCRASYGLAPRYAISGNLNTVFAFMPEHLSLIVTELLKNAMRATVEFYTLGNSILDQADCGLITDDADLPEVKVEVYKGKSEVVIKVSDKGGGIPPQKLQDIWSFGYSTVGDSNARMGAKSPIAVNLIRPDMAGYGFGLPLSRAFARYFGGDIHIQSCLGIGTDAYVTLSHMGDQEEALYFEERADLLIQNHGEVPVPASSSNSPYSGSTSGSSFSGNGNSYRVTPMTRPGGGGTT